MSPTLLIVLGIAGLGLVYAFVTALHIRRHVVQNQKAAEIGQAIHAGAMAFLRREYRFLFFFVAVVAIVLGLVYEPLNGVVFLVGAALSVLAGNVGMRIATVANVRTAEAAQRSMGEALAFAFSSGSVMGLSVVGLGLAGVAALFGAFENPELLFSFGFGASSVALFARVGGGIYTKAADIGADLVGKVEAGIPEDDPRNPATIADNVGDNVGDVAGMGADLFESYVQSMIAAMVLGTTAALAAGVGVILPLAIAAVGIVSSLLGVMTARFSRNAQPHAVLNRGIVGATVAAAVLTLWLIVFRFDAGWALFGAYAVGLVSGLGIGFTTEYYTSGHRRPTQRVAQAAQTGSATNILAGFSLGMVSTVIPVIIVGVAVALAFFFGSFYGVAIAAVGMLSTLGITLAADTYGPVADNAAGTAEMAGLGREARERAEALDAVGNTTAAIGKGFAIGSAALTAIVLFVSFAHVAGLDVLDILDPLTMIGLLVGGMMAFYFSALATSAVGDAAQEMVEEVRRQFREIQGLMEGTARPDYTRAVAISTTAALRKMIAPGLLAVLVPVAVGLFMGADALGGLLAGSIVTGFLLAVMMANAGAAWDNAKKYIEAGAFGGKGSFAHKAAVVGDTVGDPFKDTAGPSLNILLKLMAIVALIIAPLL